MKRPQSIALDFDGTIFAGEFTRPDVVEGPPINGAMEWIREQLAAGVTITIHTCRLTPPNSDSRWKQHCTPAQAQRAIEDWLGQWLTPAEVGALLFWTHVGKPFADLYLDDKGQRFAGVFPFVPWRRWAELQLGDTPAVRAATDQDLRRLMTELLRAAAGHAERVANLEHTIRVMAQATHEGDPAAVRMHAEHALGPAPDLSCETARHDFQGVDVACGPKCLCVDGYSCNVCDYGATGA